MNLPPTSNGTKRIRPGRRLALRQVLVLQDLTHRAAKGLHEDFQGTKDREERARVASAISNLGKTWVSLQDSKREILGRPKAGVRKQEPKGELQRPCKAVILEAEPLPQIAGPEEPSTN